MQNASFISAVTLEAIARKAIKDYDPSLLQGCPRAIPVEDMIEKQYGLSIEYQYIRNNGRILGATVFEDDYVPIFENEIGKYNLVKFKRGTIILDASLLQCHGDGRLRFTCAHELAHWLIHQKIYSGTDNNVAEMAKTVKKSIDTNPAIEWQADKLSSSILMPNGQVKIAFYRNKDKTQDIIKALAEQFGVSKQAMKIKLIERKLITKP